MLSSAAALDRQDPSEKPSAPGLTLHHSTASSPAMFVGPEVGRDLVIGGTLAAAAMATVASFAMAGAVAPILGLVGSQMALEATCALLALAVLVGCCRRQFDAFRPSRDAKLLAQAVAAAGLIGLAGLVVADRPPVHVATYLLGWGAVGVILVGCRLGWGVLLERTGSDRFLQRRLAVFGTGPVGELIAAEAGRRGSAIRLVGIYDDRRDPDRRLRMGLPVAGTGDDLETLVQSGQLDDVIIALPEWAKGRIVETVERLACCAVNVHSPVSLVDAAALQVEDGRISRLGPLVLQRLYRRPVEGWQAIGKSAFDRSVAAAALLLLSPVFAVIAAAIRLESRGPVFFKQTRHGISGRPVTVWKFRSMLTLDDGAVVQQAVKGDPRVTGVGAFLRKTSLDELPQLINVLLGDMSLVGPRPHAVAHNLHYGKIVNGYNRRQRVKPGITGLAQISGFRGETKDPQLMQGRIDRDLDYIRSWSPMLDLKILLLTPTRGLVHPNAY